MPRATLLLRRRIVFEDGSFVILKAWSVPSPVAPARHRYKYSLVYIIHGRRAVGYDNERGKGDHRHIWDAESPYIFVNLDRLLDDFAADVERIRNATYEGEYDD